MNICRRYRFVRIASTLIGDSAVAKHCTPESFSYSWHCYSHQYVFGFNNRQNQKVVFSHQRTQRQSEADLLVSNLRNLITPIRLYAHLSKPMADNKYVVGYAKLGTSSCKKCKVKIEKGALRIGKVTANPFSDDGDPMKQWFHPTCIFETFVRARATTKKIEDPDDAEGFDDLRQEDKDVIQKLIDDFQSNASKKGTTPKKTVQPKLNAGQKIKQDDQPGPSTSSNADVKQVARPKINTDDPFAEKDNSFRQFRRLCADIADESSYLGKTKLVHNYITKGHSGDEFRGDLYLLMKLLLPGVVKTVYNLNNKQLVKLFSLIFGTSLTKMVEDLDNGDVAETVRIFYEESKYCNPPKKSTLSLTEVDELLHELSLMTKEDDQQKILSKITKRCTANDLKMVVRLIKHDLRINAGAKHILEALDPNAYEAFQASRNLQDVVERVIKNRKSASDEGKPGMSKKLSIRASLMTPILPMLAEACRSVGQAMKKCPNGFFAEIKYDGERVQVHKKGGEFKYYSRSLKPVLDHKVRHFKEFIPKAFPSGNDLILDAEVLLVDTNTGSPLPFGTLGVHKKAEFKDAKVCLFIFDCLLINDTNLMDKPIKQRRKVLEKNMVAVKNRVHLSETQHITKPSDLQGLMSRVFKEGLEGLVLKDINSIYEPGKRHWLKVKKDYLNDGTMADSADLVVLGAYYGTGNKGGMMSIFLMGVLDPARNRWVTVSKCGSGLDDKTLETLNKDLDMVKISKDASKVPHWLNVNKSLVPDFVVRDPKKSPVWEIIGAEFSKAEIHTAGGISIRFPRVQKFRDDKSWKEATDLPRLKTLFDESKEKADMNMERALGTTKSKDKDNGGDSDGTEVMSDNDDDDNDDDDDNGDAAKHTNGGRRQSNDSPGCSTSSSSSSKRDGSTVSSSKKRSASNDSCTTPSKKSLPSVFRGCRIVLPQSLDSHKKLKRYILAFDGDVLHEFDASNATHIIAAPSDSSSQSSNRSHKASRVTEEWLWDCIHKRKLVSTTAFTSKR